MLEAIAFEGNPDPSGGVTWGAAAVNDGRRILNSITRREVSVDEFDRLVADGTLVRLPKALDLSTEYVDQPVVVAMVRRGAPFVGEKGLPPGGIRAPRARGGPEYRAFADVNTFRTWATKVIKGLLEILLYEKWNDASIARQLIQAGLTLDSTNPEVNAIWAYQNKEKSFVKEIALRNVAQRGGEKAQDALRSFERVFQGLCSTGLADVEFSFDGGTASNGGFSLAEESAILLNISNIYNAEARLTQERFPFLRDIPSLGTCKRWANSVHWSCLPSNAEEEVGDRLGQALVLNEMRETVLRSAEQKELGTLRHAYQALISPLPGTSFTLRFGKDAQAPVPSAFGTEPLRWAKQMSKSDAQQVQQGWPVPYLRLTASENGIDLRTWFREHLFRDEDWKEGVWNKKPVEETHALFVTYIAHVFFGDIRMRITHSPGRAQSNNAPTTWLHWSDSLLSALRPGFYASHWVSIEKLEDRYRLCIDALKPSWMS